MQGVFAIFAGRLIAEAGSSGEVAPAWWNTGVVFTALPLAVTGLASVLSASGWGRLHDCEVPFLTPISAALVGASMLVLTAWPPWRLLLLARVGTGAGNIGLSTTRYPTISSRIAAEERSQLMALATALTYLGNLSGFVLSGVLANVWTEAGNFALAAVLYALVLAAALGLELRARPA
jgi:predicted MFS family arabinose efflux permease